MFCLLLLLLVYNAAREMLKYALRVPFCIALPLYCVHEQPLIDESRIRNFWSTAGGAGGAAPPLSSTKMNTTPELFLFFTRSLSSTSDMELL